MHVNEQIRFSLLIFITISAQKAPLDAALAVYESRQFFGLLCIKVPLRFFIFFSQFSFYCDIEVLHNSGVHGSAATDEGLTETRLVVKRQNVTMN